METNGMGKKVIKMNCESVEERIAYLQWKDENQGLNHYELIELIYLMEDGK